MALEKTPPPRSARTTVGKGVLSPVNLKKALHEMNQSAPGQPKAHLAHAQTILQYTKQPSSSLVSTVFGPGLALLSGSTLTLPESRSLRADFGTPYVGAAFII